MYQFQSLKCLDVYKEMFFVKIKYIGDVLALNCVKVKKMIKYFMLTEKRKKVGSPHKI